MTISRSGEAWTIKVTDEAIIWKFLPGTGLAIFEHSAFPVFREFLITYDVDSLVTVIQLEDPFTKNIFETCEKSAQMADEFDVDRWAIVAEGIKDVPLENKIDTAGLEVVTTEDRKKAIKWANGELAT